MSNIIFIIFISVFLISCSEADKGINFSENFQRIAGENTQQKVASECSFEGVILEPSSQIYTVATELKITELFSKYVTPLQEINSFRLSGQVNYLSWLSNMEDKKTLCSIIQQFKNTDPSVFDRNNKISFYINAYNIFTIELILKNYFKLDKGEGRDKSRHPLQKSIRNIDDLDSKVWDNFAWPIGGKNLSLNDIEKKILIPMGDARIHFAVNCASKGCPPLRNEAFTASQLNSQLNEMSTFFVTSPAYNSIELIDDVYDPVDGDNFYEISSIFDWYSRDFENDVSGNYGSIQKFITTHLDKTDEELGFPKKDLEDLDIWFEEFSSYDWSLNEVVN